ncbi:MAG: tetratricopeptide repeat protein [Alistipes sp.]|jgi:tetratricopeptide (TPR) repeat protein|nr:tetratricopeptide repeat protein [Alistipes sp.]
MAKRKSTMPKATAAELEKAPEVKIEQALGRTEQWFEKNWKALTTGVAVILIITAGIFAYDTFIRATKSARAADAMFVAEQMFNSGDWATALNGDGVNLGFVNVVASYGGTREARLAAHYAGICFLRQGDYDSALEYLGKYRAVKGVTGEVINAENEGLKGDIYVQKGDYAAAAGHFRTAVYATDNILTTPMYLKKLGLALEAAGDYSGAVAAYKKVTYSYPTSLEARDIEKLAAAAEQKM